MLRQLPPLSFRALAGAPSADPADTMGATGTTFDGPEVDLNIVKSTRQMQRVDPGIAPHVQGGRKIKPFSTQPITRQAS